MNFIPKTLSALFTEKKNRIAGRQLPQDKNEKQGS
jgi:hypothetical protein